MSGPLPVKIDPLHLAQQSACISGTLTLRSMERLCQCLVSSEGQVEASLSFSRDASRQLLITGTIVAMVQMTCQRCLQPVDVDIDTAFTLAIISSEEAAARLQEGYEAYELDTEYLFVKDVIEDELLLSLPMAAAHEDQVACDAVMLERLKPEILEIEAVAEEKPNPFAALKQLKTD